MAQDTKRCPSCGAVIPLSEVADADGDIQCPECHVWMAAPGQNRGNWGDHRVPAPPEGRSNVGLWIGLAIGGGVLVLLAVCGGIGGMAYFWRAQQARQAQMQATVKMQGGGPVFGGGMMIQPINVPPTEFPPQTEDYAEARKNFKTKLLREIPAPQVVVAMQLPEDVQEIECGPADLRLKAWVSRDPAAGKEKLPAVLYLHDGFAFGNEDWTQTQPFRDAGYVVMMPMLRGENHQPGFYSLFYNEVDDVLAAADELQKLPYVDSNRIYLAGHMNGGTLTLLTALTTSRFRAAGAISGPTDLVNWAAAQSNMGGYGGATNQVPFDGENEKEFRMRSALAFAESFKCPVRIYVGNQEPYFKACADKTAEKAKKKKLDVEVVEVAGDVMSAANSAIPKCIEFFKEQAEKKKEEPKTKVESGKK
jgi:dienelactone hydrolase